jgi:uncharacterized protein
MQSNQPTKLILMLASMKELISLHKESIQKYTDLDFDRIMKITYLYEFDQEVQCPTWGYPTVGAYYRDASSADSVMAIRIPFLAISAKDDPVRLSWKPRLGSGH